MTTLKVRPATSGEAGLVEYMFERVGMMRLGVDLPHAYFLVETGDGQVFGGFQVFWGHAPEGVYGLASVAAHALPGHPGWAGRFRGRRPGLEALLALLQVLPDCVRRLEVTPRAADRLSCAALERAGFAFEGVLKAWYPYRNEGHVDAAIYSWVRTTEVG